MLLIPAFKEKNLIVTYKESSLLFSKSAVQGITTKLTLPQHYFPSRSTVSYDTKCKKNIAHKLWNYHKLELQIKQFLHPSNML